MGVSNGVRTSSRVIDPRAIDPRATGQPATGQAAEVPPKILLVDDDEPVLNALRRTIGRGRWEVETTTQFARARDLLTHQTFDLVISDQNMPGGTGIDLCRWLRGLGSIRRGGVSDSGSPRSARAAFVLLTAFPEQVVDQDLEGLRIAAVLGKPWDCLALRETVRSLLERDSLAAAHAPTSSAP